MTKLTDEMINKAFALAYPPDVTDIQNRRIIARALLASAVTAGVKALESAGDANYCEHGYKRGRDFCPCCDKRTSGVAVAREPDPVAMLRTMVEAWDAYWMGGRQQDAAVHFVAVVQQARTLVDGVAPSHEPSSDALRIDWCIRTLEQIKATGRDHALGDQWQDLVAVIRALKTVSAAGVLAVDGSDERLRFAQRVLETSGTPSKKEREAAARGLRELRRELYSARGVKGSDNKTE